MSIKYNEFELFEIFKKEPIVEDYGESFSYDLRIEKFKFELEFLVFQQRASIYLYNYNLKCSIFEISMYNIVEIKLDKQKEGYVFLCFYSNKSSYPVLAVQLEPTISLQRNI